MMLGEYEKYQYVWFLPGTIAKKIPKSEKYNTETVKRNNRKMLCCLVTEKDNPVLKQSKLSMLFVKSHKSVRK